ncbi:MAG TPA: acylphosphatase [Proteobacteria bacterium]|nr:acylphosphatase [Pseudomonadota bacterium]
MGEKAAHLAAAHVYISGRVQGVFFRYSTEQEAKAAGVCGWVRNLPDGRVEAFFEGPRESVERMIRWCRKGPPMARVDDVQVEWVEPKGYENFRIAY